MTDYIKRIQSSLSRDVKVSRTQIKEFMTRENIPLNYPNAEQIETVKFHFLSQLESNFAKDTVTINSNDTEDKQEAISPMDETQLQETTTLTAAMETKKIEETTLDDDFQENQPADLTVNPDVKEMVSFKAGAMGIQLAENQINIIASQIDSSGHSFLQTINDIENALIAYIDYLHRQESTQVDAMLQRVTVRMAEKNHSLHQQLNAGIGTFENAVEDLNQQQKKITSNILMRLKVPAG